MPLCPKCGCPRSRKEKEDPTAIVVSPPRVCTDCGHRYIAPLPRWVGVISYLFAAGIVTAVVAEAVTPATDLPIRLSWTGRLGMVGLAGVLVAMGTKVVRGEVGDEATIPEQIVAFRDRHPWTDWLAWGVALAVVAAVLFNLLQ